MAGLDMVGDFSSFVLPFILGLSKTRLSILVCKKNLKNLFFSLLFSAFALSFRLTIRPYAEVAGEYEKLCFLRIFSLNCFVDGLYIIVYTKLRRFIQITAACTNLSLSPIFCGNLP